MTKEEYEKEIVRMWDTLRDKHIGTDSCYGVKCEKCPLAGFKHGCSSALSALDIYNTVEVWSNEHPPKKYKVSKLEYDIMRAAIDYSSEEEAFKDVDILYELLINGYFSGAKSNDKIIDFFKNCEVVDVK